MVLLIVSLGALRSNTWTQFVVGAVCAVAVATVLNWWVPRLYPALPLTYNKQS
jgi:uncharacterized protein (DUF1778 family)